VTDLRKDGKINEGLSEAMTRELIFRSDDIVQFPPVDQLVTYYRILQHVQLCFLVRGSSYLASSVLYIACLPY